MSFRYTHLEITSIPQIRSKTSEMNDSHLIGRNRMNNSWKRCRCVGESLRVYLLWFSGNPNVHSLTSYSSSECRPCKLKERLFVENLRKKSWISFVIIKKKVCDQKAKQVHWKEKCVWFSEIHPVYTSNSTSQPSVASNIRKWWFVFLHHQSRVIQEGSIV